MLLFFSQGLINSGFSQTACANSNLSLGNFTGWSGCYGNWCNDANQNSTRCQGMPFYVPFRPPCDNPGMPWVTTPTGGHFSIETPGPDPCISALSRVFPGDSYSALIGNRTCSGGGGYVDQLKYQLSYDPTNSFFIYRSAVVLANITDPTHNTPDRRPRFTIEIRDHTTGALLDPVCGFFDLYPGDGITTWNSGPNNYVWKDWSTIGIDLSLLPGITTGQVLDIVFTVHGCSFTAHTGYAYISSVCNQMSVSLSGCSGSSTVSLTGPPGFASYEWYGPICGTCSPTVVCSGTNPNCTILNAFQGDVYRLNMLSVNGCPVNNTFTTIAFTNVIPSFVSLVNCVGNTSTFTDLSTSTNPSQPIVNRKWKFDGGPWLGPYANPSINQIFTTTGPHVVSLESYSLDGCIGTTSMTITISDAPTLTNPTLNKTICSQENVALPLSFSIPGTIAFWTRAVTGGTATVVPDPPSSSGTVINDQIINSGTTSATVTYTITPKVGNCIGTPVTGVVTVFPLPTGSISGSTTVCSGGPSPSVIFTGETGTSPFTFEYNINGGATLSVTTTTGNSVSVSQSTATPGTYVYSLLNMADANTCSQTQTTDATITVHSLPTATISGTTAVCNGGSPPDVLFTGTSGIAPFTFYYTINGGPTQSVSTTVGNSVSVSQPTGTAGTFVYALVSVTDANTCSQAQTGNITITVNPLPTAAISGATNVCQGDVPPVVTFTGASGTAPYTFYYKLNGGLTLSATTVSGNSVTVPQPTGIPGTYVYTLVSVTDANGCSRAQSGNITIIVNPLPTATIDGTTAVCTGAAEPSVTFTGSTGISPYTFYYTVNGGPTQSIVTTSGNSVTVSQPTGTPGTYLYALVSVTDGNTCSQTQSGTVTVTVTPLPTASIGGTTAVCKDDAPPDITFTGNSGTEPYTIYYTINGGPILSVTTASGNSVTVSQPTGTPGTYVYTLVSVTDGNTCSQSQSGNSTITVYPLPTAAISGTTAVCENGAEPGITFTGATGIPPYTFFYTIDGGPTQSVATTSGNSVTVFHPTATPGTFVYSLVSVNDGHTCSQDQSGSITITVNALPVPGISGPAVACVNTPGPVYYSDGGMSGYTWNVNGGTFTPGITPDTIYVTWTTIGINSVTVNYTDLNGCIAANPSVYSVNVALLPVPTIPNAPPNTCIDQLTTFSTQSGMSGYIWTVSPDGTFTGGGTDQIDVTWTVPGLKQVTVNYQMGPGCTGAAPASTFVTVYPRPYIANVTTSDAICSAGSTSFVLQADLPGSTFAWRSYASSDSVTGHSSTGGPSIVQTLVNTGHLSHTVTYRTAATANNCTGDSTDFVVTVYPVADVFFTPDGQEICSGQTSALTLQSHVAGASFSWTATPNSPQVSGYSPGSGNMIQQTLFNSGYMMPWVTYQVTPVANGCTGTQNSVVVTVNPLPVVSLTACFDTLTTTEGRPFSLKGAVPPGGSFSGSGVAGSTFSPAVAGAGVHQVRYTYTNEFNCIDSAFLTIRVLPPVAFSCANPFTDIRDNQSYPTVLLGTQCWMVTNLNYGNIILSSQMQRDNCTSERYCYNDNPANCDFYGGLYQWDEVMLYASDNGAQGLCPAGWHIPTEAEWNTLFLNYISNGFAGSALKSGGYSGFNVLMSGIRFHNNIWKFPSGDPTLRSKLYWSSTLHGPQKALAHGMNEVVADPEYTPSVSLYPALRSNSFAIRCLKD